MSEPRSVAVVIPNWNSLGHLRGCLASLDDQGMDSELLVIDNGSTDGSVAWMEQEGIPHIALPSNSGFSAAVNLGAARTNAPAVMVLNADTALEPGCLGTLLGALEANPALGGVQPRILQLDGGSEAPPRIYSVGQSLTRDGRGIEEAAGEVQQPEHLESREVFGVCGAACLLRRELFTEMDGYDESYFAFCEDVDLNVRARIAGWSFECAPEAVVWHAGNAVWQSGFENPGAENAQLVARNRLATQLKFMPARSIPRILAIEAGALVKAGTQHRFRATLGGKLTTLRCLPSLLRERRRLRETGDLAAARAWLGRGPSPVADGSTTSVGKI